MEVLEARTDGINYQLHIHRSLEREVLVEEPIIKALKSLEISAEIHISGWKGLHFVVTTSNRPTLDQIHRLCEKIKEIKPEIV